MRNMAVLHSPAFSYPLPVLVRVLFNLLIFKGKILYYNKYKYLVMRANIEEYKAVENAALKFVKSVSEGNSKYAKDLFVGEAVLFGYLNGEMEHGSIE